jgi:hypothetical protein
VSRADQVRARQREEGADPAPSASDLFLAVVRQLSEHLAHPWRQVGACVYCEPCSLRLYQGEVLTDTEKADLERAVAEADGKL